MGKLAKRYERAYDVLYNACGLVDYDEAVERHDRLMRTSSSYADAAREFCQMRGDALTSDRECAAFCIAYYWED